jgi:hypothetical protein
VLQEADFHHQVTKARRHEGKKKDFEQEATEGGEVEMAVRFLSDLLLEFFVPS